MNLLKFYAIQHASKYANSNAVDYCKRIVNFISLLIFNSVKSIRSVKRIYFNFSFKNLKELLFESSILFQCFFKLNVDFPSDVSWWMVDALHSTNCINFQSVEYIALQVIECNNNTLQFSEGIVIKLLNYNIL